MNIYKECPVLESKNFTLRLFKEEDCKDLLKVYSDKNALPFFNSDNCDGDNFYYSTQEKMTEALKFWEMSYENGYFARLSIIDKNSKTVIGTIELCLRVSDDSFNNAGILRLDVRSDFENANTLLELITLIKPEIVSLLGCSAIITKVPLYAVERITAVQKAGFTKSDKFLKGKNGFLYDGYWIAN